MMCLSARERFSEYLDGDLAPAQARIVAAHLDTCGGCRAHFDSLRNALDLLAALPIQSAPEPIAQRVRDRLELESKRPALRSVLRPARPLLRPRFAPAAVLAFCLMAMPILLVPVGPTVPARLAALAPGSESRPLFASAGVTAPRVTARAPLDFVLEDSSPEASWFIETVVARDGRVSSVSVLGGDAKQAESLVEALRRERFEPARYRGRPVAVSVYRLFSRTEVRAPLT